MHFCSISFKTISLLQLNIDINKRKSLRPLATTNLYLNLFLPFYYLFSLILLEGWRKEKARMIFECLTESLILTFVTLNNHEEHMYKKKVFSYY